MMIDLVFDYMAAKGVVFYSQEEMKTAEAGHPGSICSAMASRKKKTTNITVITCTGGWISSTLRT